MFDLLIESWYTSNKSVKVIDFESTYSLRISFSGWIAFETRDYTITARDMDGYPKLEINQGFQYVEVGAGMGGFIKHLIDKKVEKKPIVIDPSDYTRMKKMLYFAENIDLTYNLKERIKLLRERCEIVLDPDKVRLINSRVEEAVRDNKELIGLADVVVDNYAARMWAIYPLFLVNQGSIEDIEISMLKPNGILVPSILSPS